MSAIMKYAFTGYVATLREAFTHAAEKAPDADKPLFHVLNRAMDAHFANAEAMGARGEVKQAMTLLRNGMTDTTKALAAVLPKEHVLAQTQASIISLKRIVAVLEFNKFLLQAEAPEPAETRADFRADVYLFGMRQAFLHAAKAESDMPWYFQDLQRQAAPAFAAADELLDRKHPSAAFRLAVDAVEKIIGTAEAGVPAGNAAARRIFEDLIDQHFEAAAPAKVGFTVMPTNYGGATFKPPSA